MEKDEIINSFAAIHETELKDEDYLINYNPAEIFENKESKRIFTEQLLELIGTTGSAIGSGKYAGHGYSLSTWRLGDCDWVIKKHIDWNHNVSDILIPIKKGIVVRVDDEEKIAYRMLLQKILRVEKTDVEGMKTAIERLLKHYAPESK